VLADVRDPHLPAIPRLGSCVRDGSFGVGGRLGTELTVRSPSWGAVAVNDLLDSTGHGGTVTAVLDDGDDRRCPISGGLAGASRCAWPASSGENV
jgi:hypothetical protein